MMMRKRNRLLCGVILLLLTLSICSACSQNAVGADAETAQFFMLDTVMTLTVYDSDEACGRIEARAAELEKALSVTDPDSEISRLNRESSAALGKDARQLISRSLALCAQLPGSFDITVYPAVKEWGFTTGDYRVPEEERLIKLADLIGYERVQMNGDTATLPKGCMIDLGAVAKGYLADACEPILGDSGASCAILNLGGTIKLYGQKPDGTPFKVGVADPDDPASYFGYLACDEGVVATSGGYERYFERDGVRYIHILDPTTAKPVDNGTLSVSIFCSDGVKADALSTALFVMGVDRAVDYYRANGGFDFILLNDDGTLLLSEGISDRFTLSDGYHYEIRVIAKEDDDA